MGRGARAASHGGHREEATTLGEDGQKAAAVLLGADLERAADAGEHLRCASPPRQQPRHDRGARTLRAARPASDRGSPASRGTRAANYGLSKADQSNTMQDEFGNMNIGVFAEKSRLAKEAPAPSTASRSRSDSGASRPGRPA